MPDAVTYFVPPSPMLARTLKGNLAKHRAELAEQIANGSASDWGDYKLRVGVIRGLTEAIAECERIEKETETRI